jgi:hypothetical protein
MADVSPTAPTPADSPKRPLARECLPSPDARGSAPIAADEQAVLAGNAQRLLGIGDPGDR